MKAIVLSLFSFFMLSFEAQASNLHLIDSDDSGFSIYRTGAPNRADMRKFCELGIQEIMVLSGKASSAELKYQAECPTLKVIYNTKQNSRVALNKEFLDSFDQWITESKAQGKKILYKKLLWNFA